MAGKNVTIDLDGGGPMKPMTVTCKMMKDDMGVDVVRSTSYLALQWSIVLLYYLTPAVMLELHCKKRYVCSTAYIQKTTPKSTNRDMLNLRF